MVKVSVVLPNYNRYHELESAIRSILNQTYSAYEIIVIDDCSIDKERIAEIVNSFDSELIKLILLQENMGGAKARNVGIKAASGDFIAFLDSDDSWEADKLKSQLDVVKQYDTGKILIYTKSNIRRYKRALLQLPKRSIEPWEKVSDYLFVNNGFIQTSSILIDRNTCLKCMFDETLRRHQDYDFLFKAESIIERFVYVDIPLVNVNWGSLDKKTHLKKWNPQLSECFVNSRIDSFTKKAYENFIFQNIIYRSIKLGLLKSGIKAMFRYKKISAKNIPKIIKAFMVWILKQS